MWIVHLHNTNSIFLIVFLVQKYSQYYFLTNNTYNNYFHFHLYTFLKSYFIRVHIHLDIFIVLRLITFLKCILFYIPFFNIA